MGGPPPNRLERSTARPVRTGLLGVLAAVLLAPNAVLLASAHAAISDADAQAAAETVAAAAAVPSGWTGSSATCEVGDESASSLEATLRAVNAFRGVAGLAPVSFDLGLNAKALAGAALMRAGNEGPGAGLGLNHEPAPGWPCWSPAGADGAGTSNLALGASGAAAIALYVDDEGVDSLGHRRWVLDPAATVFGSGSTGTTNALTVIGGPVASVAAGMQVAWPPGGAIAASWLPKTWSISVGGSGQSVELTDPQVSMTLDGAPVAVSGVASLAGGFGTGRTLAWQPSIAASAVRSGSHQLAVSISGFSSAGIPIPVSYVTTIGPPAPVAPLATNGAVGAAPLPTPRPQAAPLPALRPLIARPRGKVRRGTKLMATLSQGTGRIVTQVQWLRAGKPIPGAVSVRYLVSRADLGRSLRVQITSQAKDGSGKLVERSPKLKINR